MRSWLQIILVFALGAVLGAAPKTEPAGVVVSVSGKVLVYAVAGPSVKAAQENPGKILRLGQTLFAGDRLKTGANGRAALVLTDGTQLKMNYNTDITLRDKNSKGRVSARGIASVKIFLGELWARVTKKNSTLEFDTPSAVAAVKGTEPLFDVAADGSVCVQLRDGKVRMTNDMPGGLTLQHGETICVSLHQLITPALVQPWNSKASTWEQGFGQASQAAVTLRYVDQDGVSKTLVLNYAADQGTTAGAQTLTGSARTLATPVH